MRRLRIAHVEVRPVLVWDDGDDLSPGPDLQAVPVPLSQVAVMVGNLPAEVEALATRLAAEAEADTDA